MPTPALHEAGEFGGWGYVLMERLHGESLEDVWPRLDRDAKDDVARQVGEVLAALHAIPAPPLDPPDWAEFVRTQRAGCVDRQRRRDLAPEWLEQIPDFLDRVDLGGPDLVPAHTEVMSAHLLITGGLLTGLFDFEPAMRAAREYEFVATGVFLTRGDRALHDGYGLAVDPRKVLACTLLHVYSNLPWYLREVPTRATTLDDLAEHWFGH